MEDALGLVEGYVDHYNNVRLNSAVGYITPKDMLAVHHQEIHADRDNDDSIFGRDRDLSELCRRLSTKRIALFYSPAGGKGPHSAVPRGACAISSARVSPSGNPRG